MQCGKSKITSEKMQILDAAIDKAKRYIAAMEAVKNGVSERQACLEQGLNFLNVRSFIFGRSKCKQESKPIREIYVSWQERLFMSIMQCKLEEVPATVNASIEYALENTPLGEREKTIIQGRFMNLETLEEVARSLNVTREWVRQIEAKALRKLKTCLRKEGE